ncbi:LPS-assembly protein LptD [bacterium]|nr:LPS-assembly protein LptD [bacterium]
MKRALTVFVFLIFSSSLAHAQVEPPDKKFLFREERLRSKVRKARQKKIADARSELQKFDPERVNIDLDSSKLKFDSTKNVVSTDKGITVVNGPAVLEAKKAEVNLENYNAKLSDDVWLSEPGGDVIASSADLNLKTRVGKLFEPDMYFADGDYRIQAREIEKYAGDEFTFQDGVLTTCECDEDCSFPWSLKSTSGRVEKEGYARLKNATLRIHDYPVFYLPYMIFPAKTKRATGLLPGTYGNSKRHGFQLKAPFFWVWNETSDATITPFVETNTRVGSELEVRKIFSRRHTLIAGGLYSNEEWRNGEAQGTEFDQLNLDDEHLDVHRFSGFWKQTWSGDLAQLPVQILIDGRHASDDLIPRELDQSETVQRVARRNDRYVNSTAVMRTFLFDAYSTELSSEYSQALITNDDVVLQRLPALDLVGYHRFRPFGDNPFGARLIYTNALQAVEFARDRGFDGMRLMANQKLKVPFHIGNFLEGDQSAGLVLASYDLADRNALSKTNPEAELKDKTDRVVPLFDTNLSTTVERVYELEPESYFKTLFELGTRGRAQEVKKVKHTLQPVLRYRYVPFVDQSENPRFDSADFLPRKNLITYGLVQRLYGRYEDRDEYRYGVEETTPEIKDLTPLRDLGPLSDPFGLDAPVTQLPNSGVFGRPQVRELMNFALLQSYDLDEAQNDRLENVDALSDVNATLGFYPNEYVRVKLGSNFDTNQSNFSSYFAQWQLLSKRGDELRNRLTMVDGQYRQLESGLELGVTDRVRLGYYGRYDDLQNKSIEDKLGVRFLSSCDCWFIDVDLTKRSNPDETRFSLTFTLMGIGEFGSSFLSKDAFGRNNNNT